MAKHVGCKRCIVLLLMSLLLMSLLFPVFLAVVHQHHDCTGHDCLVCAMIHSTHDFLKRLLQAVAMAMASIFAAILAYFGRAAVDHPKLLRGSTPVALCVRLNN